MDMTESFQKKPFSQVEHNSQKQAISTTPKIVSFECVFLMLQIQKLKKRVWSMIDLMKW